MEDPESLQARIDRLKEKTREAKSRIPKKLGRPLEHDPFDPSQRRRRMRWPGAYHTTSVNLPLWAVRGLLEAEERGLAPNRSAIVTNALALYFDVQGIGVLVPVGEALPARPGGQARRLFMPRPGRKPTKKRRKT